MHLTFASSVHLSPHPVTSLHSSLPPCQTSLRQHNSLFSLSTTVAAAVPSAWLCPHHTHSSTHPPTHPSANPLTKGQEGPFSGPVPDGLGQQCVLGLRPLKRGAFHRRGLLFDATTVCFWQDSCSKASRPPRVRLKEGTWLPISSGVSAASTWGHRPSSSPANHVWFGF